jgi:hypothetical protein
LAETALHKLGEKSQNNVPVPGKGRFFPAGGVGRAGPKPDSHFAHFIETKKKAPLFPTPNGDVAIGDEMRILAGGP